MLLSDVTDLSCPEEALVWNGVHPARDTARLAAAKQSPGHRTRPNIGCLGLQELSHRRVLFLWCSSRVPLTTRPNRVMFSLATRPNGIVLLLTLLRRRQCGATSGSRRGFYHRQLQGRFCDVVDLLVAIASRGQVVDENLVVEMGYVLDKQRERIVILVNPQIYI